jgi:hypothetical protein
MKKLLIFGALASTLVLALSGCGKQEPNGGVFYYLDFVMENQTDKDIVVPDTYIDYYIALSVTIAPGESRKVGYTYHHDEQGASVKDLYAPEDALIPYKYGYGGPLQTVTVDGDKISDAVWTRKYWSFDAEVRTYTLTITDALLDEFAAVAE